MIIKIAMRYCYFVLLLLFCCQSPYSEESDHLHKWLEKRSIPTNEIKAYIFIPLGGCHYCVEQALEFIGNYEKESKLQIIASALRENIAKEVLEAKLDWKNLYLDLGNEAYRKSIVGNNVEIFLMKDGVIEEKLVPTPDQVEHDLQRLKAWLEE